MEFCHFGTDTGPACDCTPVISFLSESVSKREGMESKPLDSGIKRHRTASHPCRSDTVRQSQIQNLMLFMKQICCHTLFSYFERRKLSLETVQIPPEQHVIMHTKNDKKGSTASSSLVTIGVTLLTEFSHLAIKSVSGLLVAPYWNL